MKVLIASNQSVRMQWEILTWIEHHRDMDLQPTFLFDGNPTSFSMKLGEMFPVFHYTHKPEIHYLPSVRAWLIEEHLKNEGDITEPVLVTDSDVLYKEVPYPTQDAYNESSETVNGYLGRDYLEQVSLSQQVDSVFNGIVGRSIHEDVFDTVLGGSWVMQSMKLEDWAGVWDLEQTFFDKLNAIGSDLQVWTAEMWVWYLSFGGSSVVANNMLDFNMATEEELTTNSLHNAGITIRAEHNDSFQKGKYNNSFPTKEELSSVTANNLSNDYAQEVAKALYKQ